MYKLFQLDQKAREERKVPREILSRSDSFSTITTYEIEPLTRIPSKDMCDPIQIPLDHGDGRLPFEIVVPDLSPSQPTTNYRPSHHEDQTKNQKKPLTTNSIDKNPFREEISNLVTLPNEENNHDDNQESEEPELKFVKKLSATSILMDDDDDDYNLVFADEDDTYPNESIYYEKDIESKREDLSDSDSTTSSDSMIRFDIAGFTRFEI